MPATPNLTRYYVRGVELHQLKHQHLHHHDWWWVLCVCVCVHACVCVCNRISPHWASRRTPAVQTVPATDCRCLDSHPGTTDGAEAVHGRGFPDCGFWWSPTPHFLPGPRLSLRSWLFLRTCGGGVVLCCQVGVGGIGDTCFLQHSGTFVFFSNQIIDCELVYCWATPERVCWLCPGLPYAADLVLSTAYSCRRWTIGDRLCYCLQL